MVNLLWWWGCSRRLEGSDRSGGGGARCPSGARDGRPPRPSGWSPARRPRQRPRGRRRVGRSRNGSAGQVHHHDAAGQAADHRAVQDSPGRRAARCRSEPRHADRSDPQPEEEAAWPGGGGGRPSTVPSTAGARRPVQPGSRPVLTRWRVRGAIYGDHLCGVAPRSDHQRDPRHRCSIAKARTPTASPSPRLCRPTAPRRRWAGPAEACARGVALAAHGRGAPTAR